MRDDDVAFDGAATDAGPAGAEHDRLVGALARAMRRAAARNLRELSIRATVWEWA